MDFRRRILLLEQHFDFLNPHHIPFFAAGTSLMPPSPSLSPPVRESFLDDSSDEAAQEAKKATLKTGMAIMACMLVAIFVLAIVLKVVIKRRERNRQRSMTVGPLIFATREDFVDGDQGPQLDHPIWYIHTVGLQQSVIDSISVFKYKKDEALTEGTECSVCLSEFEEDESLRLLPKCSHAFHIPCIDTWLRSHKNCPLCRAPIVNANSDGQVIVSDPSSSSSSSSSSRVELQIENSEAHSGISTELVAEEGSREVRNGDGNGSELRNENETDDGNHSKLNMNHSILRGRSRARSDLVDNRQTVDAEMEPIRRSASLDSSSAAAIYIAVASAMKAGVQESDNHQSQRKISTSKSVAKRGSSGSMSFRKLMKSSSIGFSLQKGPISMKRSFSTSSGKCSSSQNSRSRESILPL